jgi:hypothetical protein
MSSDASLVNTTGSAPISPQDAALVTTTVQNIFLEAEPGTELQVVRGMLAKADEQGVPQGAPLRSVLQSAWNFFEAFVVMNSGDFLRAGDLFTTAEAGFGQLGQTVARDTSVGMRVYCEAVIESQQKNIGQALKLLQQVRQYLQEVGKYTNRFDQLVDVFEPETYFVAGLNAAMEMDYAKATVAINRASETVEKYADKYFSPGSAEYKYYKGLGRYYQAYYTLLSTSNNCNNQFQFRRIAARAGDLTSDAKQAKQLLSDSRVDNAVARSAIAQVDTFIPMLEVMAALSATMLNIFGSTFKPNVKAQDELRKKIQAAVDAASRTGDQGATFVRLCEQMRNQIDNLEALAKPKKKDFGIFSGLVSCALFLLLFLGISWSNSAFRLELGGTQVLTYSLFPALVGGFGFGAIRFWRAFSPGGEAKTGA